MNNPSATRPLWKHKIRIWLPWIIITIFLLYSIRRGTAGAFRLNDYEVIRHGVLVAIDEPLDLFTAPSAEKGRRYLYPPTSMLPLIPMAFLPLEAGGVINTLLRVGALIFLLWLPFRMIPPSARGRWAIWLALLALLPVFNYINNDSRNGQINIWLAALSIAGCWCAASESSRGRSLGGILVALPALIKATPLVFLPILILRRQWNALISCFAMIAIVTIASWIWLGSAFPVLLGQWRSVSHDMSIRALETDRIASLAEFNIRAWAANGDSVNLWILISFAILGAVAFCVRIFPFIRNGRLSLPPLWWDIAFFQIIGILASPLVRKAYLSTLLFTFLVAIVHAQRLAAEGRRPTRAWLIVSAILLLGATRISTQIILPMFEANFTLFLAMIALTIHWIRIIPEIRTDEPPAGICRT